MKLKLKDWSTCPGPRLCGEGDFSAEEWRNHFLVPKLRQAIDSGEVLEVDIDGIEGVCHSFLEEAFGGIIRNSMLANPDDCLMHLAIRTAEEPELHRAIWSYLYDAHDELKNRQLAARVQQAVADAAEEATKATGVTLEQFAKRYAKK